MWSLHPPLSLLLLYFLLFIFSFFLFLIFLFPGCLFSWPPTSLSPVFYLFLLPVLSRLFPLKIYAISPSRILVFYRVCSYLIRIGYIYYRIYLILLEFGTVYIITPIFLLDRAFSCPHVPFFLLRRVIFHTVATFVVVYVVYNM